MTSQATAYSGPLLFVNHDAKIRDSQPYRYAIDTHIQSNYAKWKRAQKVCALRSRQGKSMPFEVTPTKSNGDSQDHCDDNNSEEHYPEPVAAYQANVGRPRTNHRTHTRPLTILQEGNSDPFNVFAVPVCPKVNSLMAYTRDFYLPGIQRDVTDPGSKAVVRDWTECVTFLQDEGLAYAHFTRISALISSDPGSREVTTEFHTHALLFRSKSMALLRKRLISSLQDPKVHNQILLLLNAEMYDRNFTAALSHATILARLLQSDTVKIEPLFLFKVLYHDTQRAAISLTRSMFDLENWMPDRFAPFMDPVIRRLPAAVMFETSAQGLDPVLANDPTLKNILTVLKHCMMVRLLAWKDKSYDDMATTFYGRYTVTLSMARLINHYLDAVALLANNQLQSLSEPNTTTSAHVQAFASLAALLWLRCFTRIDSVKITGNTKIFEANPLIIERLKEMLIESGWESLADGPIDYAGVRFWLKYSNVRLWALFVGAWHEQAQAAAPRGLTAASVEANAISTGSGAEHGWFNVKLAKQARAMKLTEWADVKKVLGGHLYADILEPNGAYWFAQTMRAEESAER